MTHQEEMCEERYEVKRKGSTFSMFKGLLIGGLIGASVALLTAPRTGTETRQMLRSKGNELRDRAEEAARPVAMRASEMVDRGQSVISDQKNRVESVVAGIQEGTRTYLDEDDEGSLSAGLETPTIFPYESSTKPVINDMLDHTPGYRDNSPDLHT